MTTEQPESDTATPPQQRTSRDETSWATPVGRLTRPDVSDPGAINLGIEGMSLTGPIRGFGKLWQKSYEVRLEGAAASPQEVVATWKAEFRDFWPEGNRFYAPLTGIEPGEVGLINAPLPGRLKLSTGVFVLFSDDRSFAFMTPEGHLFAGWITFSARSRDGVTYAAVDVIMRGSDPVNELALALFGHRMEDRFWAETLTRIAARFGVEDAQPSASSTCVDRRRQWKHWRALRYNAGMRATLYALAAPARRWRRRRGRDAERPEG